MLRSSIIYIKGRTSQFWEIRVPEVLMSHIAFDARVVLAHCLGGALLEMKSRTACGMVLL